MDSRSGMEKFAYPCDTFELSEQYGYLGKCNCGRTRYEHSVAQRKSNKNNRSIASLSSLQRTSSTNSNQSSSSRSGRSSRSRKSSASTDPSRRRSQSQASYSSQSSWGSNGSSDYTDSATSPPQQPSPVTVKKSFGRKKNTRESAIPVEHLALFQAADAQERARVKQDATSTSVSISKGGSKSTARKNFHKRRHNGRLRESDSEEEEMPANPFIGPGLENHENSTKSIDGARRHTSSGRGRGRGGGGGDRVRGKLKDTLRIKAAEAGDTFRTVGWQLAETGDTLRVKAAEAGDGMRALGTKVKALRIANMRTNARNVSNSDTFSTSTRASDYSIASTDDATQVLLKKHAKRGGVRKLHAGVLFSVDIGDAPLGVKISDMSKTRSGQVGFVVELVALAGLARKAGVIAGDVLVAIGDQLITQRMVWNEALACILAKQRPLRMTFFRAYSPEEQARRALQAQQCTCENSHGSTRVVKVHGVSGSAGPTMVAANCPEHGNNNRDSTGSGSKRSRRMSRMAQNAQSAVEAFSASVGVPKDTSWHLMEQIHRHRLYFLPELPTPMLWCDLCHLRILDEAFHCRTCDFDVCTQCLVPRLPSHPQATPLSRAPKRQGGAVTSKLKPTETKPRFVKSLHAKHRLTWVPVNYVVEDGKALQHSCNVCNGVCKDQSYRCAQCDYDACDDCVTRAVSPAPSQHMIRALHRHPLSFQRVDEARKEINAAWAAAAAGGGGGGSEPGGRSSLNAWRKRRFSASSNGSARSLRGGGGGTDSNGGGGSNGRDRIFWCDKCSANAKDVVFRCATCDFDLCDYCFYAHAGDPITTYVGPS